MSTVLANSSRAVLASGMGYASIGFWLFAQAPQVVKNYHLQSCEGLSLPFLCNWLFGDITNLIGCILTDQLPFQTYLAAYFCLVDFTLVVQFYHYKPPPTPKYGHLIYTSPHQSLLIHTAPPHPRTQSTHSAFRSVRDVRDRTGTGTGASEPPTSASTIRASRSAHPSFTHPQYRDHDYPRHGEGSHGPVTPPITSGNSSIQATPRPELHVISATPLPRDGSYQAIYEAALDVARAAERAEARRMSRSLSRPRRSRHQSGNSANVMPLVDEDGSPPDNMFESFHSDMSAVTSSSTISALGQPGGSHASGVGSRANPLSKSTPTLLDHRGRSLKRTGTGLALNIPTPPTEEDVLDGLPGEGGHGVGVLEAGAVMHERRQDRSKSRSISLARGSGGRGKGRRAAGVAFMSIGFLAFGGGGRIASRGVSKGTGGVVLDSKSRSVYPASPASILVHRHPYLSYPTSSPHLETTFILLDHPSDHPSHPPSPPPIDFQHLVGRVSAWACTTLYLTSRLPQIWKNFQRKSVEGLSILLFLFAFLGNTTYVLSIVLNAPVGGEDGETNHYLLEALPYLLGSGGTLLFDLTIMLQSLMYGSAPPVHPPPYERSSTFGRRPMFRRRTTRFLEDGHAGSGHVSRSPHAQPQHLTGERQPLMSGSVNLGESPTTTVRERERSLSPEAIRGRQS